MHPKLRPTTAEVNGIFLIDEDKLLALDDLLQSQFKELKKLRKKAMSAELEKACSSYSDSPELKATVKDRIAKNYQFREESATMKIDGSPDTFSSFREAILSEKFASIVPRAFDAYIIAGDKSVGVAMEDGFTGKERQMNNLPISQWLGLRIPFQQDSGPSSPRYLLICRS